MVLPYPLNKLQTLQMGKSFRCGNCNRGINKAALII